MPLDVVPSEQAIRKQKEPKAIELYSKQFSADKTTPIAANVSNRDETGA
jgi:hypothetical protein